MTKAYAVYFNQGMDDVTLEAVWATEKGAQKYVDDFNEENQEVDEMHKRMGIEDQYPDDDFFLFIKEVDLETFDRTSVVFYNE